MRISPFSTTCRKIFAACCVTIRYDTAACVLRLPHMSEVTMDILYDRSGSTLRVTFCGELDESTADDVRASLDRNILLSDAHRVIFDMSRMSFMDSSGIGVLVGRYKKFSPRRVCFFVFSPNPTVDKILRLSGIYTIMPEVETA